MTTRVDPSVKPGLQQPSKLDYQDFLICIRMSFICPTGFHLLYTDQHQAGNTKKAISFLWSLAGFHSRLRDLQVIMIKKLKWYHRLNSIQEFWSTVWFVSVCYQLISCNNSKKSSIYYNGFMIYRIHILKTNNDIR